ncbi:MAG: DUF924 family protein [Gammaproteobacteria bacterium]
MNAHAKDAAEITPRDVLQYWFGELSGGWTTEDRHTLWFGAAAADDAEMRAKFGGMIARAKNGGLESWRRTPEGLMAFIVLLDQMTRATGRGTAAAFAGDESALAACRAGIAAKIDLRMPAAHCRFFYLPLEHSENLSDQEQCVSAFSELMSRFPRREKEFAESREYARQHLEIIRRFGRFPHRNRILGRPSDAEEERFLRDGGPRFGQR